MIPGTILLSGVVGSVAYGLADEFSDTDRLGMYALPTTALLGLRKPDESHVTSHPDATYHEAGKLCRLLLGGNPTVTELLWLNDYEVRTPLADEVIGIRTAFLSAKRCRDAYLGYATQQFDRLRNRGDGSFSSDTRKRTSKHARHLWRLLEQGAELHQSGRLAVPLSPNRADSCKAFGERVAAGDLGLAARALSDAEAAFGRPGVLPELPDHAAAEAWLQKVRREFYREAISA